MNILGIIASQAGAAAVANDFESIATTTVGAGGSSTITFSSIPSTYQHLQIRYMAANKAAPGDDPMYLRLNSDSTNANYRNHRLGGSGSGTISDTYQLPISSSLNGNGDSASNYAGGVIEILDYANVNKYTTIRSLSGWDGNGSGYIWMMSELWMNTAAITQIDLTMFSGGTYRQYSHFALYGIKG